MAKFTVNFVHTITLNGCIDVAAKSRAEARDVIQSLYDRGYFGIPSISFKESKIDGRSIEYGDQEENFLIEEAYPNE